jgi:hypothetical protein
MVHLKLVDDQGQVRITIPQSGHPSVSLSSVTDTQPGGAIQMLN